MAQPEIFQRFVEPGRLALVNYGPLEGSLVTISDMISLRRVVVAHPGKGFDSKITVRTQIPITWLSLTSQCASGLCRGAKDKAVQAANKKAGILQAWQKTKWAKKIAAQKAKKELSDFGRFKLMLAKKKQNHAVRLFVRKANKKGGKK